MDASGTDRGPAGNFVLLRADALMLVVPLEGMGNAWHLDCEPVDTDVPGLFSVEAGEERRLVVAPSRDLRPMSHYPSDRFVATPIAFGGKEVFVAWSEMKVLIGASLRLRPMPALLTDPDSPFDGYVMFGGRPAFHSTAQRMLDFMFSGTGPND